MITNEPVILCRSGLYVNLLGADPATIQLDDIAHALSKLNRFTGHTKTFYSVAEHSVRVSDLLRAEGYSPRAQLAGLLHDATEAYLGDVATPLKRLLPDYKVIERELEKVIELRFNVQIHGRPEIRNADIALLAAEKENLMPATDEWEACGGIPGGYYAEMMKVHFNRHQIKWGERSPDQTAQWFMYRFGALVKEIK